MAKQLHQQELLEQAIAADEAEQARKAKEARDVRDRDYLAAFEQNKKQDESTTSPSSQEKTTAPAEGHLERGRKASPAVTPLRDVSTTNRKEAWEMPEFASPTTMKQTLNNQGRAQNLPKYPQESEDTDKGGCCTGCVVS